MTHIKIRAVKECQSCFYNFRHTEATNKRTSTCKSMLYIITYYKHMYS